MALEVLSLDGVVLLDSRRRDGDELDPSAFVADGLHGDGTVGPVNEVEQDADCPNALETVAELVCRSAASRHWLPPPLHQRDESSFVALSRGSRPIRTKGARRVTACLPTPLL